MLSKVQRKNPCTFWYSFSYTVPGCSITPSAEQNANRHSQKALKCVDEAQFNGENQSNHVLLPGCLRTDTTKDVKKQIWHICAYWHIYANWTVKMLLLSRESDIQICYINLNATVPFCRGYIVIDRVPKPEVSTTLVSAGKSYKVYELQVAGCSTSKVEGYN